MPCPVSSALTARIPKNNTLLVTIFLISGFIYITSELVLVKVYAESQRNMNGKGIVFTIIIALFFKVPIYKVLLDIRFLQMYNGNTTRQEVSQCPIFSS